MATTGFGTVSPRVSGLRLTLLALALEARYAAASPCDAERLDSGIPIQAPLAPAGFGTLPEACSLSSVALQAAGALLVAEEDFYGYLNGSTSVVVRYALPGGDWLSLDTPSVDYWYSANATVEADALELGAGAVGYHVELPVVRGIQTAPYLKLLLPTDTVYQRARRYGVAHGVSAMTRVGPSLELLAGVSFPLLLVHNSGSFHSTLMTQGAVDASLGLFSFFSVAAGLGMRIRSGSVQGFESLDPRVALRFHPYQRLYIHLALTTPILGDDRTDLAGALQVGWHFAPPFAKAEAAGGG